jgi:hypothetical protein
MLLLPGSGKVFPPFFYVIKTRQSIQLVNLCPTGFKVTNAAVASITQSFAAIPLIFVIKTKQSL